MSPLPCCDNVEKVGDKPEFDVTAEAEELVPDNVVVSEAATVEMGLVDIV